MEPDLSPEQRIKLKNALLGKDPDDPDAIEDDPTYMIDDLNEWEGNKKENSEKLIDKLYKQKKLDEQRIALVWEAL